MLMTFFCNIKKIVESEIKEDVLNVGSGEEISIYNLALLVKKLLALKEILNLIVKNLMEIQENS